MPIWLIATLTVLAAIAAGAVGGALFYVACGPMYRRGYVERTK